MSTEVPRPVEPDEAGWRGLFERNPWPMWVYDSETLRFLAVNPAALAVYGYSEAEFLALGLADLRPAEELPRLKAHLALPPGPRGAPSPWRHRRRDGTSIDVEVAASTVDLGGRPARLVVARDLTRQRQVEAREARREQVLALIAGGAPLATVLATIVRGIEADQPGMLCSVLRFDRASGQLGSGVAPSLPDFYNAAVDGLPVGPLSGSCGTAAFVGQRVVVTDIQRDPHWAAYRDLAARAGLAACWSEPILGQGGAVLGTFGVYHREVHAPTDDELSAVADLARLAAIAIERQQADDALRESQKMESLGTLAGGIAHDFNNILGAILGNLALAEQDLAAAAAPAAVADRLALVRQSALRARDLVHQILAFSRRQPHQPLRQAPGPLVEAALGLLRATLPAGVRLHTRLAADLPEVEVDATQVQQLLMNLCTNAWHAMPGAAGTIEVGLEGRTVAADGAPGPDLAPGRWLHLWVRDDGAGMDAATRARIFEPFFTTKPVGAGTGLGLAVVHGIVSGHQGLIAVDSAPGRGTTFHVYLPAAGGTGAAAPPAPPAAVAPRPAPAEGRPRHILCVDDDAVMLLTDEGLLTRLGYRVTAVASGDEAVAAVRAEPGRFDLVVSDYNMPGASGLDVAREIAAIRADLPVVICSGYIDAGLQARAASVGVRALVPKEHVAEALAPTIQRLLQGGR